jgi:hypothetical protein
MRDRGLTPMRAISSRALGGALIAAILASALLMALATPGAHAAACAAQDNYAELSGGSPTWEDGADWSKGAPPKASETACLPAGDPAITIAEGEKAEAKTLLAQAPIVIRPKATLAISEKFTSGGLAEKEATASRLGELTIDATGSLTSAGNLLLIAGNVDLEGVISGSDKVEGDVRLLSGTLIGNGSIELPFGDVGGTIEPGAKGSVGALHLHYLSGFTAASKLVIEIKSATEFDRIDMSSNIFWDGTLEVKLLGGYAPAVGTTFLFETGGGSIGEFEHVTAGFRELPEPNSTVIQVTPRPPTVVTEAATSLSETSAVIHGSVNPNLERVSGCSFNYYLAKKLLGSGLCPTAPGEGGAAVAESLTLSNLSPGTTYEYEIEAHNQETPDQSGGILTFTTLPAATKATGGGGETKTETKTGGQTPGGETPATARAAEELSLGCSRSTLVLNDVYIHGGRVALLGSAAKSFAGRNVSILFNEKKQVATAIVSATGQFSTTAPLPPAKIRNALTTRYTAAIGSVRSLHVKLTRRLQLEPPKANGTTVTLAGIVAPPLTKPIAPILVEEQLQCGRTIIAARVTPPKSGRFRITVTVPAGTTAALYQLKSSVAANAHATRHGFTTYSLQLPVTIG